MRWLLLSIIVGGTAAGDLLQSYEMKRSGEQKVDMRGLARILRLVLVRKFLLLAIACMAAAFFAFMALVTALAKFVLKEAVGLRRAAGAALVLCGVILLAK